MASCWGACFGRGDGGGGGDAAAVMVPPPPVAGNAGQSPPLPVQVIACPTAGVVSDAPPVILSSASSPGVVASGDAEGGTSPVAISVGACSSSAADPRASDSTTGENPRPPAVALGHVDMSGGAVCCGGAAGTAAQGHTSGDYRAPLHGGGGGPRGRASVVDGGGSGRADAARGRGYPIVTFRVRSCASRTRAVASGTEVHACLGRNVYVLWHTPRRGVPASEDDFRRAGPARIHLGRGVGALRAAKSCEAAVVGVSHTDCLLFLQGREVSSAGGGQVLTLLLEAPSAAECTAWAEAGSSLLTPLEDLLAVGPGGAVDTAYVQELVQAVLPPLPAATSGQPNVMSRMLGRRGRRFVLNAHHWLTPATPVAVAGASVLRKAGDAVDQVFPAALVGPALRLGLLVVQVGALAVLADGHDARREEAVGRCEGVACDLLDRVFTELQGGPTEIGDALVKHLCSLVRLVEGVLEDVEGTFFTTPVLAVLASGVVERWEQQLMDIEKEQTTSRVQGAVGHTLDRMVTAVDGLGKKVSRLGRSPAPRSSEAPDMSEYEVRWRPPALGRDYVAGVESPGRAEHTIVTKLECWAAAGRAEAPRVGVCAIGGSGKSTACAGVAACEQVRALCPRGTTWVQLNESSSSETLSNAAVALVYRFCGADDALRLLRLVERDDFLTVAAEYLRAAVVADASKRLVIIDDVLDHQASLLQKLLLVVPSATPVLFTTRSETVVSMVTGAEQVTIDSLLDRDAREMLAKAVDNKPAADEPDFSELEELELVGPVLERTERHALSLGIVASLIKARCGRWRPVVEALEREWMDASFVRPLSELDPRRSVRGTLDMSRALLPDDASRAAFEALGILPANELVGAHVLERLWRRQLGFTDGPAGGECSSPRLNHKVGGGAVHPGVDRLVDILVRAGLIHHEVANGDLAGVVVHPVICGYARRLLGDDYRAANEQLVDDYTRECAVTDTADGGWYAYKFWLTPDDGYWYNHVARHAASSENLQALVSLMSRAWRDARRRSGSTLGHQADVELVLAALQGVVDNVQHKVRDAPVLLGAVHWGLATAYQYLPQGRIADQTEQVVSLLSRGLQLVPQAVAPMQWGELQNDLGNAYTRRVTGNEAANVKEALACYRRALHVRTRQAAPMQWAETQSSMAGTYADRTDSEKEANVEKALACFRRALEVRTREAAPLKWAETQHALGSAYRKRIVGDKALNVEEAVACNRRALEVRTREAAPLEWAATQASLGWAYNERITGNKAANVEEALACFQRALEEQLRQSAPMEWASTQYSLGWVYNARILGNKAASVEEALACFRRALEVRTRQSAPLEWAETQHSLGWAYRQRIVGEKAANMEQALACYRHALVVRTQEAAPLEWAETQHSLGSAYGKRIVGDKAANMEEALAYYGRALEVRTREAAPLQWAETQHSLGSVYMQQIVGDKAANMEEALACYGRALEVRAREAARLEWGSTQDALGWAFRQRIVGDKAANMEEALACYGRALKVRTREAAPLEWASTQDALGCAYRQRIVGDKAANMEEALACYGRALEVRTR